MTILVGSQYINDVLSIYLGYDKGLFSIIIATATALGVLSILLLNKIRINQSILLLLLILLLTFILTQVLQKGKSSLSFVDFVGMCIIPVFLGGFLLIDYKLVFKCIMLLMIIAIPVYQSLFLKANIGINYDAVSMSTSYNLLPVVLVGLVHFIFFRRESTLIDKALYIISLVFMVSLIRMSYRGALLSLFITLAFALFFQKKRNSIKNTIVFITVAIIVIILLVNYRTVLLSLSALFERVGIKIAFIDKSVYLMANDSTLHGRMEIYIKAMEGFIRSPLWGNGMATFQYYTGYPFPHNFILEFLFDGGLLLFVPLFSLFVIAFRRLFGNVRADNRYKFAFVLMIGSIAISRAMVSAESWRIILLWLFLGLAFNINDRKLLQNEE